MKNIMLICEAIADEPLEELGGRTPLEVAKVPNIAFLAKKGKVGSALFARQPLSASGDVACMSLLGFDPREFYTGIAPLDALSMGIPQNDYEVAFRCDLVTVLDEYLVDNSASRITPKESKLLVEELNEKLSNPKVKFYPGEGYKNILMFSDPEIADSLDEMECTPPRGLIGQKFVRHLPKGENASILTDLMDQSKVILENNEINRVRIDLNENPANMIWPWGQGKKPKLPSFKQRYGLDGAVVSDCDFVKGLGKLLDMQVAKSLDACIDEKDFVFVYMVSSGDIYKKGDWKSKIKLIEEFDSTVVGPAIKTMSNFKDFRIFVGSDYPASVAKKSQFYGHVPFLIQGSGVGTEVPAVFSEKAAAQSKWIFDEGHKVMSMFLQKEVVG